ncbi:MAG TPA: site-specific DNA-methyltransferase [Gemmataceae bacterium]|nr:site-specific DNA-methyltransferase [Gemmataceae bacterium]
MAPQILKASRNGSVNQAVHPFRKLFQGDARNLGSLISQDQPKDETSIADGSVDLVVTSPPYWRKRDYGIKGQIGQEQTPDDYVIEMMKAISEWRRVLRPSGSIFLNIGDTYWRKSLAGIPSLVEAAARKSGLIVRNRIVWVKKGGHPDPVRDRLAARHEYILHFAVNGYYYDLFGYADQYSADRRGANPGDVWEISQKRDLGGHLAPFPPEIVRRAILLACPEFVCTQCGEPRSRRVERSKMDLDPTRPQARRALEIAKEKKLTDAHIAAIQATGISDAGKAKLVQTGTDKNTEEVRRLAAEAKQMLGGYFREFTFTKRKSIGWRQCSCAAAFQPGVVLDPFMGTGTTLEVALELGRSAIGIDLDTTNSKGAAR